MVNASAGSEGGYDNFQEISLKTDKDIVLRKHLLLQPEIAGYGLFGFSLYQYLAERLRIRPTAWTIPSLEACKRERKNDGKAEGEMRFSCLTEKLVFCSIGTTNLESAAGKKAPPQRWPSASSAWTFLLMIPLAFFVDVFAAFDNNDYC